MLAQYGIALYGIAIPRNKSLGTDVSAKRSMNIMVDSVWTALRAYNRIIGLSVGVAWPTDHKLTLTDTRRLTGTFSPLF